MKTIMKLFADGRWTAMLTCLIWSLTAFSAHAKYNCSAPSTTTLSVTYDPFVSAPVVSEQVSLSCTKASGDAASMDFSLSVDLGLNSNAGSSNASLSSSLLRYDLLKSATTSDNWTASPITGTMTSWNGNNGTATVTFYRVVPASQTAPYSPTGSTYTDTRAVTLSYPDSSGKGTTTVAGNLSVSISAPAQCLLSASPGTIAFTYTSFQSAPATASTSFGVRCVTNTPYTMALDAYSGTLLGLNYGLSLSATGTQTGTLSARSVNINGTMAGGQSGMCSSGSCTQTHTRTLTITY